VLELALDAASRSVLPSSNLTVTTRVCEMAPASTVGYAVDTVDVSIRMSSSDKSKDYRKAPLETIVSELCGAPSAAPVSGGRTERVWRMRRGASSTRIHRLH
jgi:hypothetical protein